MDRFTANGALGVLAMAQMHVAKHVVTLQHADDRFNRLLAHNSIQSCREALDELEALVDGRERAVECAPVAGVA